MEPDRPNPDELLAALEGPASHRGTLKIFLGYAAGVGKTFAMLQAAQAALNQGRDVVAGWIEPHDRPETLFQLAGLEGVPPAAVVYRGLRVRELDTDACLARRPEVLLVDELAHTNAPGSRHQKRWQDVDELLASGIEVWTTLNIQHLDSLNDVVAKVTGIQVQELVPDVFFDQVKEVEVVDVAPEDLVERLRQGKIYPKDQALRALEGFFKKDNLLALRELALRWTAERVGKEVDSARERAQTQAIWPVRERLMVSVGPSPLSEDLLRHAARLARKLDAELLAVSIETPSQRVLGPKAQAQLEKNLAVARALGAETVVLQGEDVAGDLVAYARRRNVTKLVLGKNRDRSWGRFRKKTIADELMRLSGDIDVYVLSGRIQAKASPVVRAQFQVPWSAFGWSTLILAGFTVLAILFESWGMVEANIVLTLLLSVVVSAGFFGLAPAVYTSALAVLAFNFFFTPPKYSLAVYDPQYYLVFLFLLVVGTVIGSLAQRLRRGTLASRDREQRMEALYRFQRELAGLVDGPETLVVSSRMVGEILGCPVRVLQPDSQGNWTDPDPVLPSDAALFTWVHSQGLRAGRGTGTLGSHRLSVWPVTGTSGTLGILVIEPDPNGNLGGIETKTELIESLVATVASALDRVDLVAKNRSQVLAVETEKARNAILHSLSHDLRTPIAVISGSAETLELSATKKLSSTETGLLKTIGRESVWLGRQVENLLHLSRLTERGVPWTLSWVPSEDLAYSAAGRFQTLNPGLTVDLRVPDELPLVKVEPTLVEQALVNYLDNARNYAGGQGIEFEVLVSGRTVEFRVLDRGPGVPDLEKDLIFNKFTRGTQARSAGARGTGIGLAIVHEVAAIHGGTAGVADRPGGGAVFFLRVPVPDEAPPEPKDGSL